MRGAGRVCCERRCVYLAACAVRDGGEGDAHEGSSRGRIARGEGACVNQELVLVFDHELLVNDIIINQSECYLKSMRLDYGYSS